jgi:hypothetical protein
VPVTIRLSQLFHEHFGDEIADEVVNWFNTLDTNSRSDLREINELNFARFDAKLEQRFAEQEVRMEKRFAEIEKRFVVLEAKLDTRLSDVQTVMERSMKEHARWMQLSWGVVIATLVALGFRP